MKRRGPIIGLFLGEGISYVGSRMSFIAIPWLVLDATGSPGDTGLVVAAELVPYVLAGALGAPLVDRVGARRCSVIADALSVAAIGSIPLIYVAGIGPLIGVVAVAGALRGFGDIAKRVLLPVAVNAAGMDMTRATALYDNIARLATLLGALAAGLLIARFDAPRVVLIDALSFALCAAIVGLMVRVAPAPPADRPAREPYLTALRGGLTYLRGDGLILAMLGMLFAINLFDQAALAVYLPVWAHDIVGSPVAVGLVTAAFAGGAVLGNIAFTALATRLPRYLTFTVGFIIAGGPRFFAVGLSESVTVVLVVMFVAGVGISAANPILSAVIYERVPAHLHARIFGIGTAVAFAGMPIGSLLGGFGVELFGFVAAVIASGVLYVATTLVPVLGRRTWRALDDRAPVAPPPETAPPEMAPPGTAPPGTAPPGTAPRAKDLRSS